MLNWIITWSLRNRFLVVVLSLVMVGLGVFAMSKLPIDAFPDTTPVMVQVNTVAPALSPVEIEQQVTLPVERALGGLPKLTEIRSVSKFGFGQVSTIFEDGTSVYLARQMVAERLGGVELPVGVEKPELGPISTGLGEIFHYIITSPTRSLSELTTLQDWVIRPQLQSVSGVAEINTWGGERKQYHVLADPDRLIKYELTLDHVLAALEENNLSVGGGNISRGGELHLVQGVSLTTNEEEIGNVVIVAHDGVPIHVHDVADVREGHELRRGGVTANGRGEVVHGLGFMLMGENAHVVTRRLEERLAEVRKSLPSDVEVKVVYERTELVDKVIATVERNLVEGALLVVAVLFIFLGNLRAGLIVVLAIPLAMLFAFNWMLHVGIAASLLSLGAIDFGLVVDSSVISVENSVRKLGHKRDNRSIVEIVRDAAIEVRKPTMFGELIIMVVYLPILLLEGIEGKLFRPMALTVIFALLSSLIFSLTLTPVLSSLLLIRNIKERENLVVRGAQWLYRPLLKLALRFRVGTLIVCGAILTWGTFLATRLGSEFVPRLYEMAIVFNAVRLSGISLEETMRYNTQIEKFLLERFPDEIRDVWSRTGTPEVSTDPMGLEVTDVFVTLTPREQWKRAATQTELAALMDAELFGFPGQNISFTQPIEMRMNEMIAGVRSDLGVKIFGDDLKTLREKAAEVREVLVGLSGAEDVSAEQLTGLPVVEVKVNQTAVARHGIAAKHVLEIIEAIGGIPVGQVRQGQQRFDLVVRLPERYRRDPEAVANILLPAPDGQRVPIGRLARVQQIEGPSAINREWAKRRIVVQTNVRGRDLGGFVAEARREIEEKVKLPAGYFFQFGGQYENLIRASTRLLIVIPVALALIFILLYLSTNSVRDSLIVFTGAPFAALGGVIALWLREMPFTISAGIGFIAVSGVSVLTGLVLVSTIKQRWAAGAELNQAIEEARLIRLRPILMTGLVAALGFVPMALNTGIGAEVQRPLATVVIGGVITDNLLTLLVLPALYSLFGPRNRRETLDDPWIESTRSPIETAGA
ncbi:MAG: efflux RND transporter permease subunit [Phycisphaerales bacterium]|nr:efflux RND transporter permease subunit [Phycisphaerales bacterium]